MGGNAVLRHAVHFPGADLHFKRNAFGADDGRMHRLIHIGFRRGDIVFKTSRHRLEHIMDNTQNIVTVGDRIYDDTECTEIENTIDVQFLGIHFTVNTVDMLDAAVYRGVDVIGRQPSFDLRVYGTHELFQNRHFCIQDIRDFLIAIRIQVFQGKIFQLPLCPLHAEAVSQRSIDLHGLQRFRSLFLLGLILHCAHVVETIRDLD